MSDSGAIQASTDYVQASLRTWRGSRNSRSTTCSGTWNNTGTSGACPIPADGRARVIRLTSKGRRLEQTIYAEAGAAQLRIEEILGPRRFAQLHSSLELLAERFTEATEGDQGSRGVPFRRKLRVAITSVYPVGQAQSTREV